MTSKWVLLHGGALGDLVLTIQLALRFMLPGRGGSLRVLSRTDPGDLSACTPGIVRRSTEGLGLHQLYTSDAGPPPAALASILAGHPLLSALGDDRGVLHRRLLDCGARDVFSFDPQPRAGSTAHITVQWQRELERQGLLARKCIYAGRDVTAIRPDSSMPQRGLDMLRSAGVAEFEPLVLIHPGGGAREKCWPLAGFIAVAQRLSAGGLPISFVIGPVEQERWPAEQIDQLRAMFPLIAPQSTTELAALLAASSVLLSNDSGPAHLAALLGRPTVTLFGPTSAEIWRPLGPRATALQGNPEVDSNWGLDVERIADIIRLRGS